MRYQIRYIDNLNIVHDENPSWYEVAKHFAQNGYDPLYVCFQGILKYVVTFDDFSNHVIDYSVNRSFIKQYSLNLKRTDIEDSFLENIESDRLIYLDQGKIVCEVNALIELPLQNATSKNLMALRYIQFFKPELTEYFKQYGIILLISDNLIFSYLKKQFPEVHFVQVDDIEKAYEMIRKVDIDITFDFIYSKKIRKYLGADIKNMVEFCKVMTGLALNKLKCLAQKRGVFLFFYKLPRFSELTCLHPNELDNFLNRKSLGQLIKDEQYLGQFVRSNEEYMYLKRKEYHSSQRLDNGYCFVMDESNNENMHVHNGIRANGLVVDNNAKACNFYGPCTTYGFLVEDRLTVPSLVQRYAQEDGRILQTYNRAGIHGDNELNSIMTALATPVTCGDAHIFLDVLEDLPKECYPHFRYVKDWFNENKSLEEIQFLDFPGHCNSDANRLMTKCIYNELKDVCLEEVICKEQREPLLEQSFDEMEFMAMTHSACVKQLRCIKNKEFTHDNLERIGAVIIPDNFEMEASIRYLNHCISECDALYIFLINNCIEDVEANRKINEKCMQLGTGKWVKVIQLENFFNAQKYLNSELCSGDCYSQAVFTEKIFFNVVARTLNINTRFCFEEESLREWNSAVNDACSSMACEVRKINL